jgi:hypothetical protein
MNLGGVRLEGIEGVSRSSCWVWRQLRVCYRLDSYIGFVVSGIACLPFS